MGACVGLVTGVILVTSPTHDATALAASFALFPPAGDRTGLVVAAGCIGVQGLAAAWATWRQRRQEAALRRLGVARPDVRWRGPRHKTTRPLRLIAIIAAGVASLPAAVALACARLPDQLEVGPIDHRTVTHYLLTAAAVIMGAWLAARELLPEYALMVAYGVATGFLTHLVIDACTRHGVPLFWPLWRRDVHLLPAGWRVRTGDARDTLVMALSLGAVVLAATA
jgi:membrane-bound metal-dependent hydrolase YbcI (DUF457 family)